MTKFYGIAAFAIIALASCSQNTKGDSENAQTNTHVLHAQDVDPLSPDSVISILKQGNIDFASNHSHDRDAVAQLKESADDGQHPLAIVLSCIDSRVPVETIFDKGLGDLFVTRVAGNIINPDILGSMEYACEHSGSKIVLVLGHECCGAVHSACEGVEAGNMTQMLAKIKPAIESCEHDKSDPHSQEFQNQVVYKNVENMIVQVRNESAILSELEHEGKIKIIGGVFNLHTGLVDFLQF